MTTFTKVTCKACGEASIINNDDNSSDQHHIERVSTSPNKYHCYSCGSDDSVDTGIESEFDEDIIES